jgi:hypothetical protein
MCGQESLADAIGQMNPISAKSLPKRMRLGSIEVSVLPKFDQVFLIRP